MLPSPMLQKSLEELLQKQRTYFSKNDTSSLEWRQKQLDTLFRLIKENERIIEDALHADLRKSSAEAWMTEIEPTYDEITYLKRRLPYWLKPEKGILSPLFFLSTYTIKPLPRGQVLILSPWNYPFNLTFIPLAGALAAGNTAILKPSEISPNSSGVIKELVERYFPEEIVAVVEGDAKVADHLTRMPFDLIFFTGSPAVGRFVMRNAAHHLVPVVLELGGKSPVYIEQGFSDLKVGARRIAWGKWLNAGQTCLAPDYVVIHESQVEGFISRLEDAIQSMWGNNPLENPDYPKIINQKHFERLTGYLNDVEIVYGGKNNPEGLLIQPTIVVNPPAGHPLAREEIFGPILPIFTYRTEDEAYEIICRNPYPLAFYFFGSKKKLNFLEKHFPAGAYVRNDVVIHVADSNIPFGGIRTSGIGRYHGKYSFETFSRFAPTVNHYLATDIPFRYPPYTKRKTSVAKTLWNIVRLIFG
ncbi:MAG: aldehyde dehydrogenase family protein [Chlorobi bacterium]|nr:aldehyde dehydrogenase family protein [Chlorobiota bacterium]